jgi:transposase
LNFLKKFSELRTDYGDEAILFHDELRAGTRTELGHKWTPKGHRPTTPVRIGYENTYLYLTLCPFNGEGFAAFLPQLNSTSFAWFIDKVQKCMRQKSLFIADGATAHKTELFDKHILVFERLPAACPELNPVERFFKEIRKQLKHRVFDSLQQAQERIQSIVEQLFEQEGKVVSLTCFPYLKNTLSQI